MIETFLKYLQYEKRCSVHTITSYANDLLQLQNYIAREHPERTIEQADHALLRGWIVTLVEKGLTPSSINRKIACIRSYFKFLLRREEINHDPTGKLKVMKANKRLPQFINENDIVRYLDRVEFPDDFTGWRDKLILELLYGTGIRLSELISLRLWNIDLTKRSLKVLGKRNKERIIPFSIGLLEIVKSYINERDSLPVIKKDDYLLVTEEGKQCYPMIIYRIVKKHLDLMTTMEKRSPHVLRHTFATHLLNKGAELNAVKDLLGHSSLAATQVYTHNSLSKLKSVFDQAHPKA